MAIRDRNIAAGANLDKEIVTIPIGDVGINQSDVEFGQYTLQFSVRADGVRFYCRAVTTTTTVTVKLDGTTILSAAITPTAKNEVAGTISNRTLPKNGVLTFHATTDGTGDITQGIFYMELKKARRSTSETDIGGAPDA